MAKMARFWGRAGGRRPVQPGRWGGFNADGKVNDADAAVLAAHWGRGAEEATVPEPAALVTLSILVALGGLARIRWGRGEQ